MGRSRSSLSGRHRLDRTQLAPEDIVRIDRLVAEQGDQLSDLAAVILLLSGNQERVADEILERS